MLMAKSYAQNSKYQKLDFSCSAHCL